MTLDSNSKHYLVHALWIVILLFFLQTCMQERERRKEKEAFLEAVQDSAVHYKKVGDDLPDQQRISLAWGEFCGAELDVPAFSVQYHPEASPGPHDATYLFDCFTKMMAVRRPLAAEEIAAVQQARPDPNKIGAI